MRLDACYIMVDVIDDIMPRSGSTLNRPMGLDAMVPLTGRTGTGRFSWI
jgi:hypothetical protein